MLSMADGWRIEKASELLATQGLRDTMGKILPEYTREKPTIALICLFSVAAVSWGIYYHHNMLFIIGIGHIIGRYLLNRRRIKKFVNNNL